MTSVMPSRYQIGVSRNIGGQMKTWRVGLDFANSMTFSMNDLMTGSKRKDNEDAEGVPVRMLVMQATMQASDSVLTDNNAEAKTDNRPPPGMNCALDCKGRPCVVVLAWR